MSVDYLHTTHQRNSTASHLIDPQGRHLNYLDEYCDKEQGNFQLRGLACKVYKVEDGTEGTSYSA